jgi:hypothetical protein
MKFMTEVANGLIQTLVTMIAARHVRVAHLPKLYSVQASGSS